MSQVIYLYVPVKSTLEEHTHLLFVYPLVLCLYLLFYHKFSASGRCTEKSSEVRFWRGGPCFADDTAWVWCFWSEKSHKGTTY